MSINFANVKAITIPEGSVKSIASGGVTLWEKAVHTTYRLLDYIKFSGNEYILTDHKPTNNRYYYLNFDLATWSNDKFIFAANGDATTDGAMRFTLRTSATRLQSRYGRNSAGNTNIGPTSLTANTQYQMRFRCFEDFQLYAAIANSSGTVLGYYNHPAVTFNPDNMNYLAIMAYNLGSSVVSFSQGKVYRYFYRIGDASGELGCNAYPVQRKSDGVCGLYDTVTNTFYPMQGTVITDQAAGSTVTEEWIYGGYPNEAIIPESQWNEGFNNYYYTTASTKFWDLLSSHTTDGKVANVTLTINVYNPNEDATYTTSTTNNLTYNATNSRWNNAIFNTKAVYNSNGDFLNIATFRIMNGYTSDQNSTWFGGTNLTNLYSTQGCNITGDVKLVINSVN